VLKSITISFILIFSSFLHAESQQDFRSACPDIAEKSVSAVAFIAVEENYFDSLYADDPDLQDWKPWYDYLWPSIYGQGTGFFISDDGYLITNQHVVEGATTVYVCMPSLKHPKCKAKVIGSDVCTDIALLKVELEEGYKAPYLKLADSNQARLGEPILSIGNPLFHVLHSTVTMGVLSNLDRDLWSNGSRRTFQVDAAIYGGNSGSPILNLDGEVLGVVSRGNRPNVNLIIPSNLANRIVTQLQEDGEIRTPYLGVSLADEEDVTFGIFDFPGTKGVEIIEIQEDSPAAKVGLREKDMITHINGIAVAYPESFIYQVFSKKPGDEISISLIRDEKAMDINITLEAMSDEQMTYWSPYSFDI
jgi:serine protease Do